MRLRRQEIKKMKEIEAGGVEKTDLVLLGLINKGYVFMRQTPYSLTDKGKELLGELRVEGK